MDTFCQELKDILTMYPRWTWLNKYCLLRKEWLVDQVQPLCWSKTFYEDYDTFLKELHFNLMSEFIVTNAKIVTDSDITISNVVFLPPGDLHYQMDFNVTGNGLIYTNIRNNTFKNFHFELDNSKVSINIVENVFIGSGFTIFKGTENIVKPVIVGNNILQGVYQRPALEFGTQGIFL